MPSVLAIAQPLPVDISSGTVEHHVCGNGKAGALGVQGDGDCGTSSTGGHPAPGDFDESDEALKNNVVSINGSASVKDTTPNNPKLFNVYGAYGSGTGERRVSGNQLTIDTTGEIVGNVQGGYARSDDGDSLVERNSVIFIKGMVINGVAGGGSAFTGKVSGKAHVDWNAFIMSGGEVQNNAYGAHVGSTANASIFATNNRIELSGTARVSMSVYGANAYNHDFGAVVAEKNQALISDNAEVGENVYGAHVKTDYHLGTASQNLAEISGSATIAGDVFGAYVYGDEEAKALDNRLTISGGSVAGGGGYQGVFGVFGAYADSSKVATATRNRLEISGSAQVDQNAIGGYASAWADFAMAGGTRREDGNTLEISGGTVEGSAYGGIAQNDGKATARFNTLTFSGGSVNGNDGIVDSNSDKIQGVAGSYAFSATDLAEAGNNLVTISGGATARNSVYGGYADGNTARAEKNGIEMSGGNVDGTFYGGKSRGDQSAQTLMNTLGISGGTVVHLFGGSANGLNGLAEASGNRIEISGSADVNGDVRGGYAIGAAARASGNKVYFSGGTLGHRGSGITGGQARATGSQENAEADGNEIWISGGTITNALTGGHADGNGLNLARNNRLTISNGLVQGTLIGGFAMNNAVVSSNRIDISGGEVQGYIYGGHLDAGRTGFDVSVTHNHITLSGTPTLDQAKLYGGFGYGGAGSDFYTGNTLNIKTRGLKVQSLQNFEYLNFDLPSTLVSGETLLSVSGTADLGNDSLIGLAVDGANLPLLQPGDYVVLIDATNGGNLAGSHRNTQASATAGSLQLDFDIDSLTSTNQLIARLQQIRLGSGSASLTDPALVGSATLARGADFIAQQGMQAVLAAQSAAGGAYQGAAPSGAQNGSAHSGTAQNGSAPSGAAQQSSRYHPRLFAAISGSQMEYQRSALEVDSQTLAVGAATGLPTHAGDLTLAAFIEHGEGRYHGKQHDATRAIKAQGETRYSGGGLIGRLDTGALYLEGSLRGGIAKTGYRSHDTTGRQVDYDQDSRNHYIGAHSSIGKLWNLGEKNRLDTYARALWNRQSKDEVKLSTGESLRFEAQDSRRIQLGARFNHVLGGSLNAFAGLAYEHEFTARGRARLETGGKAYKITPSGLKGGSTLLEAGLSGRPGPHSPLTLDLGIQTHTGKRKGLAAHLRVSYGF